MLSNATVTAIDPSHGSMLLSLIELKSRYTRLVIVEIMIGNKAELKIMSPLSHLRASVEHALTQWFCVSCSPAFDLFRTQPADPADRQLCIALA